MIETTTRRLICIPSLGVPVLNVIAASRLAGTVTPAAGSEPACKDLSLAKTKRLAVADCMEYCTEDTATDQQSISRLNLNSYDGCLCDQM